MFVKCAGVNSCKALPDCKTAKNECKGQNGGCKGRLAGTRSQSRPRNAPKSRRQRRSTSNAYPRVSQPVCTAAFFKPFQTPMNPFKALASDCAPSTTPRLKPTPSRVDWLEILSGELHGSWWCAMWCTWTAFAVTSPMVMHGVSLNTAHRSAEHGLPGCDLKALASGTTSANLRPLLLDRHARAQHARLAALPIRKRALLHVSGTHPNGTRF
jgi:hypothetical protein